MLKVYFDFDLDNQKKLDFHFIFKLSIKKSQN